MLKILLCVSIYSSAIVVGHAQFFEKLKKEAQKVVGQTTNVSGFTEADAASALREALSKGAVKGVSLTGKLNGFLQNPEIKIPFPKEAQTVETTLRKVGAGKLADDVITSLNRAAEDAAVSAKDILLDAITKMTIQDAISIVKGNDKAGTEYLQRTSSDELRATFAPIVKASLEKVNATKYWSDATKTYNKVPFVTKVETDLTAYVTQKALDGLFLMIAKEEIEIRKDPAARTTDLLKKVFGGNR